MKITQQWSRAIAVILSMLSYSGQVKAGCMQRIKDVTTSHYYQGSKKLVKNSLQLLCTVLPASLAVDYTVTMVRRDTLTFAESSDASACYRGYFNDALQAYGIVNAADVPLKNVNHGEGGDHGESTLFGVTIHEAALNQKSRSQQVYTCWHEAAHYALKHKPKQLRDLYCAAAAIPCWQLINLIKNDSLKKIGHLSVLCCGIQSLKNLYLKRGPWEERSHEKEADAMAIEYLIKTGRENIVVEIDQENQERYQGWNAALNLEHEARLNYMRDHGFTLQSLKAEQLKAQKDISRFQALYAQARAKLEQESKEFAAWA